MKVVDSPDKDPLLSEEASGGNPAQAEMPFAVVDGEPVTASRSNVAFIGLPLPAGEHEVLLVNADNPTGPVVSGLALALIALLAMALVLARRRREGSTAS